MTLKLSLKRLASRNERSSSGVTTPGGTPPQSPDTMDLDLDLNRCHTQGSVQTALASPDPFDSRTLNDAKRVKSCSTVSTTSESFAPLRRVATYSFIKSTPTVNVYTHCGRHTDQLLFGGPSLSGLAKALIKKTKREESS